MYTILISYWVTNFTMETEVFPYQILKIVNQNQTLEEPWKIFNNSEA